MEGSIVLDSNVGFKQLFQSLPSLIVALSPDLQILAATDSFLKGTYTSRQYITGKPFFSIFQPRQLRSQLQSREILERSLHEAISTKKPSKLESLRYDLKQPASMGSSFEERHWCFTSTPVLDDEGSLGCILLEAQDITLRKLDDSKAKFQHSDPGTLARMRTGVIWECDETTGIITWSDNYKDLFGYSDKDLVATREEWAKRIHPDDLPEVEASMEATMKAGSKVWTKEYRYRKADDTYTTVLDHAFIVYDETGKAVHTMGSIMDQGRQIEQEKLLNQANERYRLVAMAASDVIWEWDLQLDTVLWNEGFFRLFGYKESEVDPSFDFWSDRVHPVDHKRVHDSLFDAVNTQHSYWEETYRFRCADGSYKLVRDKGRVLYDEEGLPVRMIGSIVDITEQKQQEEQMQQQMSMVEKVLDSLPFMIWTAAPDGAVNYYNQHWYNHTGTASDELKGWGWSKLIHPEDYENTRQQWVHAIETGTLFETENRWRSADGQYRWFLARAIPVHDQKGNITMWVGYHTPIGEQLSALNLQDTNSFTRYIAEAIPQMVWSTTPHGTANYFNKRWYTYTGLQPNESMALGWQSVVHPDDLPLIMPRWKEALQTSTTFELEMRFREGATGNYRWFLVRAVPMRNEHGDILKWFGTCTDINDYKHAGEALIQNFHQLGSFVTVALQGLKLAVLNIERTFDKLVQELPLDNEATTLVQLYKQSVKRLQTMSGDIAQATSPDTEAEQTPETIDLEEITREVLADMAETIQATHTTITYNYSLAPALQFNRSSLHSILYNLLAGYSNDTIEAPQKLTLTTNLREDFIVFCMKGRGIKINKLPDDLLHMPEHRTEPGPEWYIAEKLLAKYGIQSSIENTPDGETTRCLYFKKKNV